MVLRSYTCNTLLKLLVLRYVDLVIPQSTGILLFFYVGSGLLESLVWSGGSIEAMNLAACLYETLSHAKRQATSTTCDDKDLPIEIELAGSLSLNLLSILV